MFRWVNSSPVLFAQPLESKNRQRFRRFKSIAEKMSNLLSDRSVLALRSSPELPVERIGKVLDVQNCHSVTPKLHHNGGTVNDVSRLLLAPKNLHKSLRSGSPSRAQDAPTAVRGLKIPKSFMVGSFRPAFAADSPSPRSLFFGTWQDRRKSA